MDEAIVYQIQVEGTLKGEWDQRLFPGLDISFGPGATTTIVAHIPDAAALRGLVNYLWDLNLQLISLQRIQPNSDNSKMEDRHE